MLFNNNLSEEELSELFSDSNKCLSFLSEIKWGDGYRCKKCDNDNYCAGKTPFSRRCTKCKNDESATSGTIFHHCRFELHKAFYIAYTVCKNNDDISTYEYARRLSLRQMTCWKFKDKLKKAIVLSGEKESNWIEILT